MVELDDVVGAMHASFETTGAAFPGWPDPHRGRSPDEAEYSRVSNPARYRMVGARVEAWFAALTATGLATVERDAAVEWRRAPGAVLTRTDRVVPRAPGALSLVAARSRIGDVEDAGTVLGVGHPAVAAAVVPDCGCDACDFGSELELQRVDECLAGVVSGTYRRLERGDSYVEVLGDGRWSARNVGHERVDAVLADPTGWDVISGASWLD